LIWPLSPKPSLGYTWFNFKSLTGFDLTKQGSLTFRLEPFVG